MALLPACAERANAGPVAAGARQHAPGAAAIVVTNTRDDGPGSLRHAIANATDGTTIRFDPSIAGKTIVLTSGGLYLETSVTIEGPAAGIVVSGTRDHPDPVFGIGKVTATLRNLTVTGGRSSGIINGGTLAIDHSLIRDNSTVELGIGGGILNFGALDVINTTVVGNFASARGGGIAAGPGATRTALTNVTVWENTAPEAGEVYASDGLLILRNSIIGGTTDSDVGNPCEYGSTLRAEGVTLSNVPACAAGPRGLVADPGLAAHLPGNE